MSLEDFCSLGFEEFDTIFEAYEEGCRSAWERMRWQTTLLLQPYSKGCRLTPREVLRFPWDGKANIDSQDKPLTREERKRRVDELTAKWGDKPITAKITINHHGREKHD